MNKNVLFPTSTLAEEGATRCVSAVRTNLVSLYLRPSVWLTLSRIIYLSALYAIKRRKLTRYCIRSRKYFATAFGFHPSTISSITTELAQIGFLEKRQLRPINLIPQPCIYKTAGVIWEIVKAQIVKFLNRIKSVAQRRFIVSKDYNIHTLNNQKRNGPVRNNGPTAIDVIKLMEKLHPELV